ncbi:lipopolysaccharide biosynthesis protein [Iodidimonas gelatinilytica]|uniref:Lipopolysaccharide biosynthesis protein n=1 Tax=Iodidimonas gelatinilytica TaxID=1236966 RepID=A0A5A7MNI6_9PROT|nr:oligosaccharide flippase family protein [Iodidimonas gelatinilytica]GEQ96459.1 lipopolysaccharide biosynthesis protein [Iodidimonas gelatinilytica]
MSQPPASLPSLKRSLAYVFGGRFMRALIQIASAAIIARLLTPEEMGIFAVASASIAISTALAEFGIHPYLVQVDALSKAIVGRAFGLMGLINWSLAFLLFFGRGVIAQFYGNPEIENVIAVLSLNFLFNPFVTIGLALLMRELRYGKLTIINIMAGGAGSAISVLLALQDFGPISLAFGSIVMKLMLIIGIFRLKPMYLSFRPRFRGLKEIVGFGSWAVGASLVQSAGNQSPELIIGRGLGLEAAGLFDRGMTVTRLVNQQIAGSLSTVLTPFFAQERRDKLDLKARFLIRLQTTAGVIWPLMLIMAGSSYSLILFLFGPQWTQAAPVAGILAISATLHMPFGIGRQLLLSHGKVKQIFLIETSMQLAKVALIVLAARHGLPYIAAALIGPAIIFIILANYQVSQVLSLRASDWWTALKPSLLVTFGVGLTIGGVVYGLGYAPKGLPIANLAIYGSIGLAGWLISLWLVRHPMRLEITRLLKKIIKKNKSQ